MVLLIKKNIIKVKHWQPEKKRVVSRRRPPGLNFVIFKIQMHVTGMPVFYR